MHPASGNSGDTTEVVYVCSPDWQSQLFVSLDSLLCSGSTFDRVTIYCVGTRPAAWRFRDPRVEVIEVAPRAEQQSLTEGRFLVNKTYLCRRPAARVIYLDADTIVRQSIDCVWNNQTADVIGRVASRSLEPAWPRAQWQEALKTVGATDEWPYLNSGFLIFQHAAQQRLEATWPALIVSLCDSRAWLAALHGPGTQLAEQLALSLAIAKAGLSWHLMTPEQHAFGWQPDPWDEAIVLHTSGSHFERFAGHFGFSEAAATRNLLAPPVA